MTSARRFAAIALAILFVSAGHAAVAAEYVRADLRISVPWARASQSKVAEAFLTVKNTGTEPERLLAISSPVAKRVELRRYEAIGGVNGSKKIQEVEIPPGKSVTLAPGTTVLSLVGLKRPLQVGTTVTLTLTFERAGAISVVAPVYSPETTKPPPPPPDAKAKPTTNTRKPRRRRR